MEERKIRSGLKAFIKRRDLTVSNWCNRAGIDPATIYAFLSGKTHDIGSARLIALAEAENVSTDDMIGRRVFDREQILDRIIPVIEMVGPSISMRAIADAAGVRIDELQVEWLSVSDVIVSAYLRSIRGSASANIKSASGKPIVEAARVMEREAAKWALARKDFFLAFRQAIISASDRQREAYLNIRGKLEMEVKHEILDKAPDLLPMPDEMRNRLASIMITLSYSVLIWHIGSGDPEKIAEEFAGRIEAIMAGKFQK